MEVGGGMGWGDGTRDGDGHEPTLTGLLLSFQAPRFFAVFFFFFFKRLGIDLLFRYLLRRLFSFGMFASLMYGKSFSKRGYADSG